jgi:photosystem II stability/assembly factor-like uncharacterized protein
MNGDSGVRSRLGFAAAVAVVVVGVAGAAPAVASVPAVGHPAARVADGAAGAAGSAGAAGAAAHEPAWLQTLYMTSAKSGWALHWNSDPAEPAPAALVPARTTDGGRTWADVAPAAASSMLAASYNSVTVDAAGGSRAWFAVTVAKSENAYCVTPHRTEVFGTADGGRSWTESALIRAPGFVQSVDFTGTQDGWLLQDLGAEGALPPGPQNWVQLYRTSDGGRDWSLVASTVGCSQTGTSRSGLPSLCDKTGTSFATSAVGWLTADCNDLAESVLVTRDGGQHWAEQPLPLKSAFCQSYGCSITPPQFFGQTGYLTVGTMPRAALLVSHDLGRTWTRLALPAGAGIYPQVRFFSPTSGVIVSAGAQGSFGTVFYLTSNGGKTWQPVRQGMPLNKLGLEVTFVSPRTGFAWIEATDATTPQPMYETSDSGRTWTSFTPHLAG